MSAEVPFYLVAHSYGCLVAMEIANVLEKEGLIGTLILIDGSPKVIVELTKDRVGRYKGVEFEMKVLEEVVPFLIPLDMAKVALVIVLYIF